MRIVPLYSSRGDAAALLAYPHIYNLGGEWIGVVTPDRDVYSTLGYYVGYLREDRRIVRVTLTAAGQELHQIMNAFLRQRIEQILQHFTAEEREQLVFLLQKVAAAFAESEEAQQ